MPMHHPLEAGREADVAVAILMGHTDIVWLSGAPYAGGLHDALQARQPVPCYTTDMAAAWPVAERMGLFRAVPQGGLDVGLTLQQNTAGEWEVRYRFGAAIARAETAPLAICRAAVARAATGFVPAATHPDAPIGNIPTPPPSATAWAARARAAIEGLPREPIQMLSDEAVRGYKHTDMEDEIQAGYVDHVALPEVLRILTATAQEGIPA